jgi:hypothetical protein
VSLRHRTYFPCPDAPQPSPINSQNALRRHRGDHVNVKGESPEPR